MSTDRMSLMNRVSFLGTVAVLTAGLAGAPSLFAAPPSGAASFPTGSFSSSVDTSSSDEASGADAALPSAPSASGASAAGGQGYNDQSHGVLGHMAFEAGGGFNAPTRGTGPYVTWGGNFTVGAGWRFDPRFSLLAEYQFIDDKLPGALIAETGSTGGNAHIWSLTLDPVVDLMPKSSHDVYLTGGGGFYRKVTSFTILEPTEYCTYFYCGIGYEPATVGHFSSNQGGWNVGAGYQHRMGGVYGDGKMKLFAEVRYLDIDTPAVNSSPNGLGVTTVAAGTKLVPVTLGLRW